MRTVTVSERVGKDGVLHVSLLLGTPDTDYDVVVVLQPKESKPAAVSPENSGWPPGYFDLAGSIDDETFVRPPQGEMPKPVDFE